MKKQIKKLEKIINNLLLTMAIFVDRMKNQVLCRRIFDDKEQIKKFFSLKRNKMSDQKRAKRNNKHDDSSSSSKSKDECVVDDKLARLVEKLWKKYFPSALLLPVIGLPSNANGVATLTHGTGHQMSINGLLSNSPLANNALYSFECATSKDGCVSKFLNLYEIMVPDIPGKDGEDSTAEYYVKLLNKYGLSVAGVHFHWWGQNVIKGNTLVAAVHHQGIDISPVEFSKRTIKAILKTMKLIEERTHHGKDKSSHDKSESSSKDSHDKSKRSRDDSKSSSDDNHSH